MRLDEFARALGVATPPEDLVERSRELDRDVADLRDLIVHPKLSGDYARQFLHSRGGDLESLTLFPKEEVEASHILIAKVDSALDAYTRDVVRWVTSVLGAAAPRGVGDTRSSGSQ